MNYETLKTCRQFFPLSFKRLSSISIISIKSPLWDLVRKKDKAFLRKETQLIVSHLSDFVHLSARGAPWIVRGGSTDLGLSIWVAFGVVFGDAEGSFAKMLHGCVEIASCGSPVTHKSVTSTGSNRGNPTPHAPFFVLDISGTTHFWSRYQLQL